MNEIEQEDWLDRQLRECAPYIDDAGFTARVLAKLPPPAQKRVSLRAAIILGLTVLGCALAYVLSDGGRFVTANVIRLSSLPTLWLLMLAVASGLLVSAGGMVAAISKSRELQS